MMNKVGKNAGFGIVAIIVIVAAVVVIGIVGYVFAQNFAHKDTTTQTTPKTTSNDSSSATKATENVLAIPEWGVQMNFQGAEYVQYQLTSDSSDVDSATLSLKDSVPTSETCKDLRLEFKRYTTAQPDSKYVKHVGSYYYKLTGTPITCEIGDDPNAAPNVIRDYIVQDLSDAKFTVTTE